MVDGMFDGIVYRMFGGIVGGMVGEVMDRAFDGMLDGMFDGIFDGCLQLYSAVGARTILCARHDNDLVPPSDFMHSSMAPSIHLAADLIHGFGYCSHRLTQLYLATQVGLEPPAPVIFAAQSTAMLWRGRAHALTLRLMWR